MAGSKPPRRRGRGGARPLMKRLKDRLGLPARRRGSASAKAGRTRGAGRKRGPLRGREVRLAAWALAAGFVAGLALGLWLAADVAPQMAQAPAPPAAEPPATEPAPAGPPATAPGDQAARRPPAPPAWRANAAPFAGAAGRPLVAVIIDDMGLDRAGSDRAAALPGPLTMAFLPYARDLDRQVAAARAAGHEILVHIPAEPASPAQNPGPRFLAAGTKAEVLRRDIAWNLAQLAGYVGVSNHMGSRFTRDRAGMAVLMDELDRRGLLFVDSRTTPATVGAAAAAARGVPFAERDVFLDNEPSVEAVLARLAELEAEARRTGSAVGIGHPHEATIEALARWLPEARRRGVALAPVSAVVAARQDRTAEAPGG